MALPLFLVDHNKKRPVQAEFQTVSKMGKREMKIARKLFYESNAHRFIVIFSLVLSLFVCRGRLMMLQQVALNNLK